MDHRKKLGWAKKHFDALNQSVMDFVNSNPYAAAAKFDPKESVYTARIKSVKEPPPEWPLMIGDVVHNLRSSLDAITYALSVKNLRRVPTGHEVKQIQFVIVDDYKDWPGECGRRLQHVSADAQAIIKGLQPAGRRDLSRMHVLSGLRDISNVDKHRHITTLLMAVVGSKVSLEGPNIRPGTLLQGYAGPIEQGAVLARWRFADVPPGVQLKMQVKGEMTIDIAFGNVAALGPDARVIESLRLAHLCIEKFVFPPLEALL